MKTNEKKDIRTAGATLRYSRIAPRKMRLVAHAIKNMHVNQAEAQLFSEEKRPGGVLLKLLKSAIANAKNKDMRVEKLIVREIRVDNGPMLKRWMPRAQGRATPIQKKTSHVSLILQETEKDVESRFVVEKKAKKEAKKEAAQTKKTKDKAETEAKRERDQEKKAEAKVESKTQDKGFSKRVFRRKSV